MGRDSVIRRVAQKELRLYFSSPVAWLFLAAFNGVVLFVFFWVESFFARNIADLRPLFQWMPLLLIFLCATLTMRMWSEERRSGTLEHVHTQPVPLWHFVMGKFLASFSLLLLALAGTAPLAISIGLISNLDWGPVIGGYLATALAGAAYIAVGLFISARTDNPIVSLIGTVALCGLLYLLGSPLLTSFFSDNTGALLRLVGSGARFDSITRGVLDLRDMVYYISLVAGFLTLNTYVLEKERWAHGISSARHRHWRSAVALLLGNLLLLNTWLAPLSGLRTDLTAGKQYSISQPTQQILSQLEEPLLIRGYFSATTHPLLAPLVPQLQDLVREYELAGDGRVRIEIIDPAEHPDLELQANQRYGIDATPFQIADRHQSALVNAYFNLLVRYGDQYQTLGFGDMVEVQVKANQSPEVILRNPEYDLTHAIKKVLSEYRMGGDLFDGIAQPVELIGYVSNEALLPEPLQAYRQAITPILQDAAARSDGKLSVRFIDPQAANGQVARQIGQEWGFHPMVAALGDEQQFHFYLTLADTRQVVQLPTEKFDAEAFRLVLDTGLKRFASGFTKTVALSAPNVNPQMAQYGLGGPTFQHLEQRFSADYSLVPEDLTDGTVAAEADILLVLAPELLGDRALFAIDQFLMRGGSIVIATSPFTTEISDGQLTLQDWNSGLGSWLTHHGITVGDTLVLDRQNAAFPSPVIRRSGDLEFRDVQLVDYPYLIDVREQGLASDHPITAYLPQITMAWASPIEVEPRDNQRVTVLLKSSPEAWLSDNTDITPALNADKAENLRPPTDDDSGNFAERSLGVVVQGRFNSYFRDRPVPETKEPGDYQQLIKHSPESARIVLFSSNDFLDDQVLNAVVAASGNGYLGPLQLLQNTVDWALQEGGLLNIRSRAHFNRTLPPMERSNQVAIEYLNYAMGLGWLVLLALTNWLLGRARRRHYAKGLAL
ncbi:MAG: ABC-2 type transport system permease protein [Bacteroidia bacterium]|jgi:ABC-2 type transport system permease protein